MVDEPDPGAAGRRVPGGRVGVAARVRAGRSPGSPGSGRRGRSGRARRRHQHHRDRGPTATVRAADPRDVRAGPSVPALSCRSRGSRPCPAFRGSGERSSPPGRSGRDEDGGRPQRRSTAAALLHPAEWSRSRCGAPSTGARRPATRPGPSGRHRSPAAAAAVRAAARFRLPCTAVEVAAWSHDGTDRAGHHRSARGGHRTGAVRALRPRAAGHHRRPGPAHARHRLRGHGRRDRDARGDRRPRGRVGLRLAVLGVPRRVRAGHGAGRALVRPRRAPARAARHAAAVRRRADRRRHRGHAGPAAGRAGAAGGERGDAVRRGLRDDRGDLPGAVPARGVRAHVGGLGGAVARSGRRWRRWSRSGSRGTGCSSGSSRSSRSRSPWWSPACAGCAAPARLRGPDAASSSPLPVRRSASPP